VRDLGGEWKGRKDNTWLSPGCLTRTKGKISEAAGFDSYLEAVFWKYRIEPVFSEK
jgi:hypothetical protein